MSYSVGFGLPAHTPDLLALIPDEVWQVAHDSDGSVRDGAWVAELTGLLDLTGWPTDMRVIVRKERPHPGAQLRFTDTDGLRVTAVATNTARGQLADLELRHRRRARCEDRIRNAQDTGLTNLPRHEMNQNRIWCAIVSLACELTAWLQMLALHDHPARRWEPKRLRHRLFSVAGRLGRTARRTCCTSAGSAAGPTYSYTPWPPCQRCPPPPAHARPPPPPTAPPTGPWTRRHPTTSGELPHPHTTINLSAALPAPEHRRAGA